MNPELDRVTARFGSVGAAQPTHAYRIHVYRATVLYRATVRVLSPQRYGFCTANGVSDRDPRVEGGGHPEDRGGKARGRSDRRERLLTIRRPRATGSEIAVALWSRRTSTTIENKPLNQLVGQRTSIPGVSVGLHLAPPGSPCPCSRRHRSAFKARTVTLCSPYRSSRRRSEGLPRWSDAIVPESGLEKMRLIYLSP